MRPISGKPLERKTIAHSRDGRLQLLRDASVESWRDNLSWVPRRQGLGGLLQKSWESEQPGHQQVSLQPGRQGRVSTLMLERAVLEDPTQTCRGQGHTNPREALGYCHQHWLVIYTQVFYCVGTLCPNPDQPARHPGRGRAEMSTRQIRKPKPWPENESLG